VKLIYGSRAMKHWFKDSREPQDLDYINSDKLAKSTKDIEHHWTDAFQYLMKNKDNKYVDPDFLYTIKVSHAAWDINWDKTMLDINYLQNKGCKLNKTFFNLLIHDWDKIHGTKKVKMNVRNQDFFKSNIKRRFNHEWLHEQFAFFDRPLNERIRKDLNSPLCSNDLWDELTDDEKFKCALEEIFVLTTERYIFIDRPLPIKTARLKTLKNMITSTTSGWFNLYLIENFESLRTAELDYLKQKIEEVNNGC
jgi:hypothetical protein